MSVDREVATTRDIQAAPSTAKRSRMGQLDDRFLALVWHVLASDGHAAEESTKAVGVTSSIKGEGTTTVASNMAITAAALNIGPVLLVDANVHRPNLHRVFGVDGDVGLQNTLCGELTPLECITPSPVSNLSLMLNGRIDPDEVAVYSKSSIDELLDELKDVFRLILFDLPPANDSNVCRSLAGRLDGVLFVVDAERVDRDTGRRMCDRLRRANANLLGAVYNRVPGEKRSPRR
ncbi:MAG: CpsD/CapB family tyrosine-protein kinase [Pirellulales bacterium]